MLAKALTVWAISTSSRLLIISASTAERNFTRFGVSFEFRITLPAASTG
jgi:hypothetical protein